MDSDLSDHEEEFYYQEVQVSVDTVTETFAEMHTSSPPAIEPHSNQNVSIPTPQQTLPFTIPDHDYQKKVTPSAFNI